MENTKIFQLNAIVKRPLKIDGHSFDIGSKFNSKIKETTFEAIKDCFEMVKITEIEDNSSPQKQTQSQPKAKPKTTDRKPTTAPKTANSNPDNTAEAEDVE